LTLRDHPPVLEEPHDLGPEGRFRVYLRAGVLGYPDAFAPTMASVGVALEQLDQDARAAGLRGLVDRGMVGVYDAAERRWIVLPWPKGGGAP